MHRHYGISLDVYTKRNQSWLLAKAEIEYLKPIRFGQQFFIETKVISSEGSKAIAEFKFHSLDKKIIHAAGTMTCHLFDLATRKLVPIDESERTVFLSM